MKKNGPSIRRVLALTVYVVVFEPKHRAYSTLMAYWYSCLLNIPTASAPVGWMFAKQPLKAAFTNFGFWHTRPQARRS